MKKKNSGRGPIRFSISLPYELFCRIDFQRHSIGATRSGYIAHILLKAEQAEHAAKTSSASPPPPKSKPMKPAPSF